MDAYTPLSYGEIRRIHFAKTGSVAAQIRALAERAMDVGEYPNLGRAFAGIIARNEKLKAAYLAETSDQDVVGYRDNDNDDAETEEEEETKVDANGDILTRARAAIEAGDAADIDGAVQQLMKTRAGQDLWQRREQEYRTPAPVRKTPGVIGDAGAQRLSVTRTPAHEAYEAALAEVRLKQPGLSDAEVYAKVVYGPEINKLLAQNRVDHFAKPRGKP
jgi:hypothetical protein